jgi:hypothetical protein
MPGQPKGCPLVWLLLNLVPKSQKWMDKTQNYKTEQPAQAVLKGFPEY